MNCFLLILSYLIGAFPSGKIAARLNGVDLSKSGSGNIGATNVARTIGRKAGILVLLTDILKGYLACLIVSNQNSELTALAGLLAVCGHCFSVPGLLKGGKGVATSLGVFFFINPLAAAIGIVTFALIFATTKIVSLGSIIACLLAGLTSAFTDTFNTATYLNLAALIVIARHHLNIKKLLRGEELKFSPKK